MLQSIHDKAKGWFAYLIVGFISIPFMLWGINSYLGGGDKLLAAQVNGEDISLEAFQRALQLQRERMREMFGGNVPQEMLDGPAIKQTVVEGMIRDELLRQFAENSNFRVADQQLATEIRSIPVFQENGEFSAEKYTQLLASRRMDKVAFEQDLRFGMRLQQFSDALQSSEFLTAEELKTFAQLSGQQRNLELATVDLEQVRAGVEVSDEQMAEYYESHQDRFQSDEKVKLAYLALNPEDVVAGVEVSEDAVQTFYEQEKDRFRTPEARLVSHILIKSQDGRAEADLQAKADEAVQKLASGTSFDTVAKELSEDTLSADAGGDLGEVYPGDLDPALDKVIFTLAEGKYSDPVMTAQGVQIVSVREIKPGVQKSYEDVRDEAELELKRREADTKLLSLSEQLLTLTYENSDSLDIAADAIGIPVKTTDWITRTGGEGLGQEARVRELAFSDEVLQSAQNSDVVELDDGRQIVIRVVEHQPASTLPYEEVSAQVKGLLTLDKAREEARNIGLNLLASAQEAGLESAAAEVSAAEYSPAVTAGRRDESMPADVLEKAFKMTHPSGEKPAHDSLQRANGDYVVIQLNKVEPSEAADDKLIAQARSVLAGVNGQRAFDAIYRYMESKAEIKIFTENFAENR